MCQEQRKVLKAISYTPETQKRVLGQILSIFPKWKTRLQIIKTVALIWSGFYELTDKNRFSSSVRSQYAFLRSVARRFALEVWLRGCFFS